MTVSFETWKAAMAVASAPLVKLDPERAKEIRARFSADLEELGKNYERDSEESNEEFRRDMKAATTPPKKKAAEDKHQAIMHQRDTKLRDAANKILKQRIAEVNQAIKAAERR